MARKSASTLVERIAPLTLELWPAFELLFGGQGACMGCWCTYWLLANKDWQAARGDKAKRLMKQRVKTGPPPGVLAMSGDEAIGWLQIGPRAATPQWNSPRRVCAPLAPADAEDESVWTATCFFVKSGLRRQGLTGALLKGGLAFAKHGGARVVEACPIVTAGRSDAASLYVGHFSVFERAGFREIARRKDNRPLMRLNLPSRKR